MPKKATTKKGSNKPSSVKKPAAKKATAKPSDSPPVDELAAANAKIAELETQVEKLKASAPPETVEKPAKPPGCTLSFPRRK